MHLRRYPRESFFALDDSSVGKVVVRHVDTDVANVLGCCFASQHRSDGAASFSLCCHADRSTAVIAVNRPIMPGLKPEGILLLE